ncbi:Sugar phosphate isomerase/epimerase [Streptomyces sp. KS_16]|nr:sugar phosphate isomerase/epimerase [Streptomyces sp. 2321.6]SDR49214.1 Sugar phosphate isomerase/epimerase [Streptomyces sp. KS_16]SEC60861.1 Sugar phosphate isomerase/epimerase [Streptomyces sp. 2133.1]SNC68552.1 Sugar phosphate isomerase/epimerase [Streptomyces sp. 2114.4]
MAPTDRTDGKRMDSGRADDRPTENGGRADDRPADGGGRTGGRIPAMRYAFSTLGVPGMPVAEVLRLATDAGYQGVELRAHPEEPVHPLIGARERAVVRGQFADAGVEVLAVAGYAQVAAARDTAGEEELAHELTELVHLAADLGAPYVRVFPGGDDRPAAEADADAARRLAAVAPLAAERGVRVLLETHDSHRTGAAAARVLGLVGHRRIGALWDVQHSWLGGEEPVDTHAALAPHLGYVQVKDVASAEERTPLPLGAGTLPLAAALGTLVREPEGAHGPVPAPEGTYDQGSGGWLCWEYEKRWYPEAADLPALLAPGRAYLQRLLGEATPF